MCLLQQGGFMKIRKYKSGEEKILRDIFYSSIHENAKGYYSDIQLNAWAPSEVGEQKWANRIKGINPFVIVGNEEILGYADLQDSGYIDHFFVKGGQSNKGIGTELMKWILAEAEKRGIKKLTSDVSLAAQAFFTKMGFEIVRKKKVMINDVELENALMIKTIELRT